MSMYPHRSIAGPPPAGGGARLNELLDQVRIEFEAQSRQYAEYEHQRKAPDLSAWLNSLEPLSWFDSTPSSIPARHYEESVD